MGNYFVMSNRFDKCNASDFGLIQKDSNTSVQKLNWERKFLGEQSDGLFDTEWRNLQAYQKATSNYSYLWFLLSFNEMLN